MVRGSKNMASFDNGLVQDDSGKVVGNVWAGVVRDGEAAGAGNPIGKVKHGLISDTDGNVLFNVKKGVIRDGVALGGGLSLGKVGDLDISGALGQPQDEVVAGYHFLVKKVV
ncbi:MAG: hypothetical protein ACI85N_000960 [Gammaproteobacteria bacterium]|jgi:hypothetical protein